MEMHKNHIAFESRSESLEIPESSISTSSLINSSLKKSRIN